MDSVYGGVDARFCPNNHEPYSYDTRMLLLLMMKLPHPHGCSDESASAAHGVRRYRIRSLVRVRKTFRHFPRLHVKHSCATGLFTYHVLPCESSRCVIVATSECRRAAPAVECSSGAVGFSDEKSSHSQPRPASSARRTVCRKFLAVLRKD